MEERERESNDFTFLVFLLLGRRRKSHTKNLKDLAATALLLINVSIPIEITIEKDKI